MPSEALPQWRSEKGFACGLVILVHLLAAWVAMQPPPIADDASPSMQLVFIRLPTLTLRPPPAQARSRASAAEQRTSSRTASTTRTSIAEAPAAVPQTAEDDRWDLAAARIRKDDGIHFDDNALPTGFNPIRMGPPERFRMRGQASLADIVRAVSSTLFWPAGYTDDPCPGLRKAVEMLSGASTERERVLLEDAVLLRSRYCR